MPISPEITDKDVDEEHTNSNDKLVHWKFKKQRVFTTTRFPSKATKVHETQLSFQKLLESTLVKSKHDTKKKKDPKE